MFENLSRAAEQAAANVSRREFFGQLGRGAMGLAAGIGGLLAMSAYSQAASSKVCGPRSNAGCRNKVVGSTCRILRYKGRCRGGPACYCS